MFSLSRARALGVAGVTALGLGAVGSLVEAPASLAAAPSVGLNCQTDGKISGIGSTLQVWFQNIAISSYASNVCGNDAPTVQSSNAVPGATYTGTFTDELGAIGNIMLTVSSDDTQVNSYLISAHGKDENGNSCYVTAQGGTVTPITNDAFDYTSDTYLALQGTFTGAQSASGSFDIDNPAVGGSAGCNTGTIGWRVTTSSAPAGILSESSGVEAGNTAAFNSSGVIPGGLSSPLSDSADFSDPFAPLLPLNDSSAYGGHAYYGQNYPIMYNDPSAFDSAGNNGVGSGAGQAVAAFRSEAFAGTDIPVTNEQYTDIENLTDPGSSDNPFTFAGSFNGKPSGDTNFAPSWEPLPASNTTSVGSNLEYPEPGVGGSTTANTGDQLMVLPVGISAVGIFANLPKTCVTSTPIKVTTAQLAAIEDGADLTWGSVGATGISSSCTTAITRQVRNDNSGTTQGFLNYLSDANGYSTADNSACAAPTQGSSTLGTWGSLQDNEVNNNTNVDWPGANKSTLGNSSWGVAATATCSAIYDGSSTLVPNPYNPAGTGAYANGPSLIYGVDNTNGAVGYADVSDIEHDATQEKISSDEIELFDVANAANTQEAPLNGSKAANCTLGSSYSPPSGAAGITGQGGTWDLTADGGTATPQDDIGYNAVSSSSYPICLLTWDMVWSGEDGNTPPSTTTNAAYDSATDELQVQTVTGLPSSGTLSFADPTTGDPETLTYTGIAIPSGTTPANVTTGTLEGVSSTDTSGLNASGITLTGATGTGGPIPDLTADQRRNLYSYYTYLFSPAGQEAVGGSNSYYTDLPQSWWDSLRKGFQNSF